MEFKTSNGRGKLPSIITKKEKGNDGCKCGCVFDFMVGNFQYDDNYVVIEV